MTVRAPLQVSRATKQSLRPAPRNLERTQRAPYRLAADILAPSLHQDPLQRPDVPLIVRRMPNTMAEYDQFYEKNSTRPYATRFMEVDSLAGLRSLTSGVRTKYVMGILPSTVEIPEPHFVLALGSDLCAIHKDIATGPLVGAFLRMGGVPKAWMMGAGFLQIGNRYRLDDPSYDGGEDDILLVDGHSLGLPTNDHGILRTHEGVELLDGRTPPAQGASLWGVETLLKMYSDNLFEVRRDLRPRPSGK